MAQPLAFVCRPLPSPILSQSGCRKRRGELSFGNIASLSLQLVSCSGKAPRSVCASSKARDLGFTQNLCRRRRFPSGCYTSGRVRLKRLDLSARAGKAEASPLTKESLNDSGSDGPLSSAGVSAEKPSENYFADARSRLQCLEVLVLLRRLYRNVLKAEKFLAAPLPNVDTSEEAQAEAVPVKRKRVRDWVQQVTKKKQQEEIILASSLDIVEYAQDIQELKLSLQRDLGNLEGLIPIVFQGDVKAEEAVGNTVTSIGQRLQALVERVERTLPEDEWRRTLQIWERLDAEEQEENVQTKVLRRLESIQSTSDVLTRMRNRLSSVDLSSVKSNLTSVDLSAIQARGKKFIEALAATWRRLNGSPDPNLESVLMAGLPRPPSARDAMAGKKLTLVLEVEALDKKLGEMSRARESRLRENNILARTRLASEVRSMDDEVNELRKVLAVRTMQLEMTVIFLGLWEDLMLITDDVRSEEEEALVVAEFGLLDNDLAKLLSAVDRNEAILIQDEELETLATEIPDLKLRLGIPPASSSIPLQQRLDMAIRESWLKVKDGAQFFWRGLRLLAGDLVYSGRLFWIAINGTTLAPREVQTLRRTARDLITLIPFTIILVAPITPVGHVMVFSFIQRYFPGFFPSSFSSKRQTVMVKYDAIREQIRLAATEREKADAAAAAARVEAEAFQVSEDEEGGEGAGEGGASVDGNMRGLEMSPSTL